MNHWKRYLLAIAICIIGGTALTFVVALAYVILAQPPLDGSLDVGFPQYLRPLFSFGLVFTAVYLSSYLLPIGRRRQSSIISGAVIILCFACIGILYPGRAPFARLAIALFLDMVPVILAVILSALLHSKKSDV